MGFHAIDRTVDLHFQQTPEVSLLCRIYHDSYFLSEAEYLGSMYPSVASGGVSYPSESSSESELLAIGEKILILNNC